MLGERLSDLDELVLHCRNDQARAYIAEAVACYRGGAFRAAIVATWVAVVFDIVHKLHELDLMGDARAKQEVQQFERVRTQLNVAQSLAFEHNILEKVHKEFEFLSVFEFNDLNRLNEDRNRCAHPSMNAPNEAYQPTAELARLHLRNAVIHLLQHPPVQGKAALDQLMGDITSAYFPTVVGEAVRHFQHGVLAKPRPALIQNLVRVLLKQLLQGDLTQSARRQYATALTAARELHRNLVETELHDKLSELIRRIDDSHLWRAVDFLQLVPDCWDFLQPDVQGKIEQYIATLPTEDLAAGLLPAFGVPSLRERAALRLNAVNDTDLRTLISAAPPNDVPALVDRAVELYVTAATAEKANSQVFHLLMPLAPYLRQKQVARINAAADHLRSIGGTWGLKWLRDHLPAHGYVTITDMIALVDPPTSTPPTN